MPVLEPILRPVERYEKKGRFHVILDVPRTSTLDQNEIDTILALSSWSDNGEIPVERRGGRSTLFARNRAIRKNGIVLHALQINGIGYSPQTEASNGFLEWTPGTPFLPPSVENFQDQGDCPMATSVASNRRVTVREPEYLPAGTFGSDDLVRTVSNTAAVAAKRYTQFTVPHVEAYGRFLDDELCGSDGQFGFLVLPIPSIKLHRYGTDLSKMAVVGNAFSGNSEIRSFIKYATDRSNRMAESLRELHDVGFAHLQPHANNWYMLPDRQMLMDWETCHRFGTDRVENALSRALDLIMPSSDIASYLLRYFSATESMAEQVQNDALVSNLETYGVYRSREIDMSRLRSQTKVVYRKLDTITAAATLLLRQEIA